MRKALPAIVAASFLTASAVVAQTTRPDAPAPAPTAPQSAPAAQPTAPPAEVQTAPPAAAAPAPAALTMTEDEAKTWIDRSVYSADDRSLGHVAAVQRDPSGKVVEMHADIGGFLGIGTTRIRLTPADFRLEGDRVVLNMPADQAKQLPKVERQ